MSRPLVLVDLQNDFLGASGLEPAAGALVERAAALLSGFRASGLPVVHVRTLVSPDLSDAMPHWRRRGDRRCVRGSPGAAPPRDLRERPGEPVVGKTSFDAFSAPDLPDLLVSLGAEALVLAGVHLHACVRATALGALQRGLGVTIVEDASASDDPLHAAATRRWLLPRGVRFATASGVLSALPADPPMPAEPNVDGPVGIARTAATAWRARSHAERASLLERAADALGSARQALALQICRDVGKPITQALGEVDRSVALIRAASRLPEARGSVTGAVRSRRVPHGVIALVTPWNNPIAIPCGKFAPALAFGNAVVWKPAPAATGIAASTLDRLREAGLPEGVLSLAPGDAVVAAALMEHPGVDAVSISGSSAAGWTAQEACARRRIPLQAELGGNNGAIVWDDADFGVAAAKIAEGAFGFAGQRCTANRRVIVSTRALPVFLRALADATARIPWGDPLDPATVVGPLVSEAAARRVEALIERARASACEILTPHAAPAPGPAYVAPAILVCDDPDHEIVQEEAFGPVLVVQPARDEDHAIELLNGVRQGLVAALFSDSDGLRARFLSEARAGLLKLGQATSDAAVDAPFGGFKASGLGPPEHGPGNVEFYTRWQALYGEESSA